MLLCSAHAAWGEKFSNNLDHDKTLFEYLQGQPTENQLLLGMVTLHLNSKSRRIRQWNNNLVGLQYKDFFICTFENSFYNQTCAAGLARNLSTSELSNNWDMTFGYRRNHNDTRYIPTDWQSSQWRDHTPLSHYVYERLNGAL